MNIDTGKTRIQTGDTPEVKALRERVSELETKIEILLDKQKPAAPVA